MQALMPPQLLLTLLVVKDHAATTIVCPSTASFATAAAHTSFINACVYAIPFVSNQLA